MKIAQIERTLISDEGNIKVSIDPEKTVSNPDNRIPSNNGLVVVKGTFLVDQNDPDWTPAGPTKTI